MTWEEAVQWCLARPEHAALARDAYFGDPVDAAKRYKDSAEYAALSELIPQSKGRALDLGSGNGILAWALASDGWEVTAVEPDPSALVGAGAIRALSLATKVPITVVEAMGEDIPLQETGFDLVVARQVLHHAVDLPAFCCEMQRLSRPGATAITLRDHVVSGPSQLAAFLASHPLHHLYGGEHAYTLTEYRDALTTAGFKVQREMKSFQSVLNYAPMTSEQFVDRLATAAGPLYPIALRALRFIPFSALANVVAHLDSRPGRLVSFLCTKEAII